MTSYIEAVEKLIDQQDDKSIRIKELEAKLDKAMEALRVSLEGLNWAKAYLSTSGIYSVQVTYADAKVYAALTELEK